MKLRYLSARLFLSASLAVATLAPASLLAQAGPEQVFQQGNALFDANRYEDAAKVFEAFLKDFPTSPLTPIIQFRYGQTLFLLGKYDESQAQLAKVLDPSSPAADDIKEGAASLIPQILAAKAGDEEDKAKQKAAYEAAIKAFDDFLQKYPQSAQAEYALYGRSLCNLQIEKYQEAADGLRQGLAQFARSETILDTQYLLALTLAAQAALALQADPGSADGVAKSDEAQKLLRDIITQQRDIALLNDAQFQIAEIYLQRGNLATDEAAKKDFFDKAMASYRRVLPSEPIIAAQTARLENVKNRKIAAGRSQNVPEFKRLETVQDKEAAKLERIKAKGDLTLAAQVKIAQIYFLRKAYDEARVILAHKAPYAKTDELKRDIAYYLTLTYTSQQIRDKAVEAYEAFRAAHKDDPIGDNLPLAIGSLFLSNEPVDAEKAIAYFKQGVETYPEGRFTIETLTQQASALTRLGQHDQALASFQGILAKQPKPEIAGPAEFGIGVIYKDTGKPEEALAAFRKVRETYKGTPEAENSSFFIGQILQGQGKLKDAIAEYSAFIKEYPKSVLFPLAKYFLGETEFAAGNKEGAEQLFREVANEYPDHQVAPPSYFRRAAIFSGDGKADEMVAVMREFITKYPEHENTFFAYDSIGKNLLSKQQPLEAVEVYQEMVTKQPKAPRTAEALKNIADIWFNRSNVMGRYLALNEEQRPLWVEGIDKSLAAAEKIVKEFPESPLVVPALDRILQIQKLLTGGQIKTPEQVTEYFQQLAGQFEEAPATQSKILFTLASYTYESDKDKALEQMEQAYRSDLVYSPLDLDLYGAALLESGQLEKAERLYLKLASDYPNPGTGDPKQAPPLIQEAQSISLYGQGRVLQDQDKIAEAKVFFDRLKELYPWSPKLLEADYGIARALVAEKKFDEAARLLIPIIRSQNATVQLRADATFLNGEILLGKGDVASAIDQFSKVSTHFAGVDALASEGLWRAGQLLEQQAATLPTEASKKGVPTRATQIARALRTYQNLVRRYPNSPHAKEAQERVKALTPPAK